MGSDGGRLQQYSISSRYEKTNSLEKSKSGGPVLRIHVLLQVRSDSFGSISLLSLFIEIYTGISIILQLFMDWRRL